VPEYVLRVRVGRDVVDEVQQRLREVLLMGSAAGGGAPKLAEYSGKGALGGWLRVSAVRMALNQIRDARTSGASTTEPVTEDLAVGGDPELAFVKGRASELLGDAFRRVVADLDPQERAMLRLHYIDGLTMDRLSTLYKTPRSTVARRIAEVRQAILASTEALLREEQRLSPSAAASVLREAKRQINVTMSRLLQ
jgi:RNA polymerase sigma-70 factor, ECF subfamily